MSEDTASISAIMFKKGSKVGFLHKRFCELNLENYQLIIYKNSKKSKVERIIEITPDTLITKKDIPTQKKSYLLTLSHPEKKITFLTQDQDSRDNFFESLRETILSIPGLNMNCFDIISVLGRGYFGKVILCRRKNTNSLFAIKAIKKKLLQEEEKLRSALTEREILRKCDNPFIVKINFAFDTESKLYLGLEYVFGGNLQRHIKEDGELPKSDIKLYLAEVAIALNYLHSNGIIYRDLKSSNILIDSEGHIKLADFGLSILFDNPSSDNTTHSFVGTPECIPPEMIHRTPYGYAADWWQYGILAYELIFKEKPFKHPNTNKLFELICTANVIYPYIHFDLGISPSQFKSKSLTHESIKSKGDKARKSMKNHHAKEESDDCLDRNSIKVRSVKTVPLQSSSSQNLNKKGEINSSSKKVKSSLSEEEIVVSFIDSLLEKNPKKRMTYEEIIHHPFFDGYDFDEVFQKKVKPTYVPPSNELNIDSDFANECPADSYASSATDISSNVFADFSFYDGNIEEFGNDEENVQLLAQLGNENEIISDSD